MSNTTTKKRIVGYRTMTAAQRYNARMDRIWEECKDAKTRLNASSRTETATTMRTSYFDNDDVVRHCQQSRDCKHGQGFTYDFCPIVNRVNAHDQLVRALKAAQDWFEKPTEYANTKQFKNHADQVRAEINQALKSLQD